jgi:SAM-dependent methyltransferase
MLNSIRAFWWRLAPNQLLEKYSAFSFDKRYGTETKAFAELRELDIASKNKRHGERYQPSPVYSLRRLLKRLNLPYSNFSFVDFGSGKGRTLLIASELPFKQVIGVEFSEDLHRTAANNIKHYGSRSAGKVEAVHADATQFALPAGDLVLYFFNPFTKPVLDKVLENITTSVTAQPRRIILIYLYLPERQWVTGLEGFSLLERWRNFDVFEFRTE